MNDELGDETYIAVLLVSSALSPPQLTLIGNDEFLKYLRWISWCFWVFADISARSSRKKKSLESFAHFFFLNAQFCARVSASNFQVLIRKSGGARASGTFIRFLAGPACIYTYIYITWWSLVRWAGISNNDIILLLTLLLRYSTFTRKEEGSFKTGRYAWCRVLVLLLLIFAGAVVSIPTYSTVVKTRKKKSQSIRRSPKKSTRINTAIFHVLVPAWCDENSWKLGAGDNDSISSRIKSRIKVEHSSKAAKHFNRNS